MATDRTAGEKATFALSKVPQITIAFWIVKILATTVGETGGDALSMTLDLGYAVSTVIFFAFFCVALIGQIATTRYHPFAYWAVVVATTTVGTTTSDYLDRTAGLGYVASSIAELALVIAILAIWRATTGSIAVDRITTRRNELFYWVTILVSNTLGTALGDFAASSTGLGFGGGALVFAALLALIAAAHYFTKLSRAVLFWAAYVLTRPLGATVGDVLTKPTTEGGLDLSRIASSFVILALMVIVILATSLRKRSALK
ncbi:MAG: hypothetical protein H0W69_01440 [Gemmatimonadaceae bacterium]|nr:hypothetical protein [Gemmatimonadaceae bacterium]